MAGDLSRMAWIWQAALFAEFPPSVFLPSVFLVAKRQDPRGEMTVREEHTGRWRQTLNRV